MATVFHDAGLGGVLIIEPRCFSDSRGFFLETWRLREYTRAGSDPGFVQDNHYRSAKGVIRGLHYQLDHPQAKLIYVVRGTIFDVAVDIRKGSETFGQWTGHILSDENHRQLFVPAGFAHGFSVLSHGADVMYRCSDYYTPGDEYGIAWNDPDLAVDWRVSDPLVSDKDGVLPLLRDIPEHLLPRQ